MESGGQLDNNGALASAASKKQLEYLRLLEQRNRLKKLMKEKSESERAMEEKERGFNTHFRGANASKDVTTTTTSSNKKGIARIVRNFPLLPRKKDTAMVETEPSTVPQNDTHQPHPPEPARKGWAMERPKFLLGLRWGVRKSGESDSGSAVPVAMVPNDDVGSDDDYGEYEDDFIPLNDEFAPVSFLSQHDNERELERGTMAVPLTISSERIDGGTYPASPTKRPSEPIIFLSPSRNRSEMGTGMSGSFGSPLKVQLSPAKLFKTQNQQSLKGGLNIDGSDVESVASTSSIIRSKSKTNGITVLKNGVDREGLFGITNHNESSKSPQLKAAGGGNVLPVASTHAIAVAAAVPTTDITPAALNIDKQQRTEMSRAPSTRMLSDVKISIRMRIHSTWKKTKFVSLEAFRLGFIDDANNDTTNDNNSNRPSMLWIDLRPFTVKISSGMQVLSTTSEAVRTIESLIHGNHGSRPGPTRPLSQCWKGPMNSGSSLDVTFEGFLPSAYVDRYPNDASALQALCVSMWNASDASLPTNTTIPTVNSVGVAANSLGNASTSLLSSAAKDIDIYMGNACVWSGMLASESDSPLSLKEGYPSDRKVDASQPTQTYYYVSSSHNSNNNMGSIQGDGNATGGFLVFRAPSVVVRLSSSSSSSSSIGVETKTVTSSSASYSSSKLAVGHADDGHVTTGTMQGYQAAVAAIAMKKQALSSSPSTHEAGTLSTETVQVDGDKPLWLVGLRPPSASAVPSSSSVMVNDGVQIAIGLGRVNRPLSSGRRRAAEMMTAEDTTQPPQPQPHPPSQPNYDSESSSSIYIPSSLTTKNMDVDDPKTNTTTATTLSSSRSSRRLRPRGDNDASIETTNLPTNHLTLTSDRRNNTKEVRDDDDQLRRSLDAMNLSDRFNRGRLSHGTTSMTKLDMGTSMDMGISEGHLEDGLAGEVLGSCSVDHMIPSSSLTEGGVGGITRVRMGRRASNARASNEGEEHKDKDTVNLKQSPASNVSTSAAKRESRARRIEAIQATVQSTVAGLALAGLAGPNAMSSPSGVAGNVMISPSVGIQEGGKKKRGVGVEVGVGSESQNAIRGIKTPPTAEGINLLAPGLVSTPPHRGHVDNDDEVLAFDNDDLANDSDNNINNDHQIHVDQPSYVPTLLASPPSRPPPDAASLKLSASMTHPLMGTSSPLDVPSPFNTPGKNKPTNLEDSYVGFESSEMLFSTPILPCGRVLRLEILSTWGDQYYVGLNGIDIFDHEGKLVSMARGDVSTIEKVTGNPRSINILTEYQHAHDPRVASNLVDGMNFTRDDLHVWLAPLGCIERPSDQDNDNETQVAAVSVFDSDEEVLASVGIHFTQPTALSMIRIFNYNKSRIHCARGVRRCRLRLDDDVIFEGEIRMATGLLTSADTVSEVVLFTTDPKTLEKVAKHDEHAGYYADDTTADWLEKLKDRHSMIEERPRTAEKDEDKENGVQSSSGSLGRGSSSTLPRQAQQLSSKALMMTSHVAQQFSNPKSAQASSWSRRTRAPLKSIPEPTPTSQSSLSAESGSTNDAIIHRQSATGEDKYHSNHEDTSAVPWGDKGGMSHRPLTSTNAVIADRRVLPIGTPAGPTHPISNNEDNDKDDDKDPDTNDDSVAMRILSNQESSPPPSSSPGIAKTTGSLVSAVGAIVSSRAAASATTSLIPRVTPHKLSPSKQPMPSSTATDTQQENVTTTVTSTTLKTAMASTMKATDAGSVEGPTVKDNKNNARRSSVVRGTISGAIEKEEENDLLMLLGELEDPAFTRYGDDDQNQNKPLPTLPPEYQPQPVTRVATNNNNATAATATTSSFTGWFVESCDLVTCRTISIIIESTWGDKDYVGLSGVEFLLGNACQPALIDHSKIHAEPRDLSAIGHYDDRRVVENLFNGYNDTSDDRHMWLIPFTPGAEHVLRYDFGQSVQIAGLRLWNYNKSNEDILRGAKLIHIKVGMEGGNQNNLGRGSDRSLGRYVLRMAPGCDGVEFGQTIFVRDIMTPNIQRCPGLAFSNNNHPGNGMGNNPQMSLLQYIKPTVKQDYEVPLLPSGMLWKFTFYGNWYDSYYIGLDGIEMYDSKGVLLNVIACGATIAAVPHSLADLEPFDYAGRSASIHSTNLDPRIPEKLFTHQKHHNTNNKINAANSNVPSAWLTPLSCSMTPMERVTCTLRIMQKQSIKIAKQQQHRHSSANTNANKPSVASLVPPLASVRMEDLTLPRENALYVLFPYPVSISLIRMYNYSKTPTRGVKEFGIQVDGLDVYMGSLEPANKENPALGGGQSIVFTTDPKITLKEKDKVNYCGGGECDVLCIDERKVMIRSRNMYNQPNPNAEGVSSDLDKRPKTSFHH